MKRSAKVAVAEMPLPTAPALSTETLMIPLPRAPAVSGMSRSSLYRAAADGRIRMVKSGRATLVDAASLRAYLASLPSMIPGGDK